MTPNLIANPLSALVAGPQSSSPNGDNSLVLLAQSSASESGADPEAGNFLQLLQSLNLSDVGLDLTPDRTGLASPEMPALALPESGQQEPGIAVVQAAVVLPGPAVEPAPISSGNASPLSGSAWPLQSTLNSGLLGDPGEPAQPSVVATESLTGRVRDAPAETSVRQAPSPTPPPATRPLLPAPAPANPAPVATATEAAIAPQASAAALTETIRDWVRLQTGGAATHEARVIKSAASGAVEFLVDTGATESQPVESARATGGSLAPAIDRSAQASSAIPTFTLSRAAGSPGWDQALGQRIVWMAENGMGQAELRLDPPHLGSVSVRIVLNDDQAQVVFQTQNPAAREALESALPKLREMFAEQGLQLNDGDTNSRNEQQAGAGGQSANAGPHDDGAAHGVSEGEPDMDATRHADPLDAAMSARRGRSLVDVYA